MERIQVRGVVKRFGSTFALRGVDAAFGRGLTLIEGSNGSGKSTLMGVIGGVIRPSSGTVEFVGALSGSVRAELGWVSHESLTYGDLTAKQNIEMAGTLHGISSSEAWERARERFGLAAFGDRKVRTHSRGQRQRVALARALVHRPSVLLLDEPSTGLDKDGVKRLVEVVAEEIAAGAMVLLITHEPQLFAELGGGRVRLQRGRAAE